MMFHLNVKDDNDDISAYVTKVTLVITLVICCISQGSSTITFWTTGTS